MFGIAMLILGISIKIAIGISENGWFIKKDTFFDHEWKHVLKMLKLERLKIYFYIKKLLENST